MRIPLQSTRALAECRHFCLLAGTGISAQCVMSRGMAPIRSWANEAGTTVLHKPARTAASTQRGCCWTKARSSIGRIRTDGRRYSPAVRKWPSTRRGSCWTKARRSARRRVRRRCTLPARTANVGVARLLLDKGRRSIGRIRTADAAVRRLQEGPRRRGAAVAGQRRGGRPGDGGRRDAAVCRVREGPRRRGAAVAGQRRGGRSGGRKRTVDAAAYIACENGHVDLLDGAAAAGQRRGGRSAREGGEEQRQATKVHRRRCHIVAARAPAKENVDEMATSMMARGAAGAAAGERCGGRSGGIRTT